MRAVEIQGPMETEVGTGRVLVNDRCLYCGSTGISTYLRNVLAHWPKDSQLRLVCHCRDYHSLLCRVLKSSSTKSNSPRLLPLREVIKQKHGLFRLSHRIRWPIQNAYAMAFRRTFHRGGYGAYFEPNNIAIPRLDGTVTAVHDLSVIEHPEWHPRDRVMWWEAALQQSLESTRCWISPSRFTSDRMVRVLGLPAERVTVIPLAARPLPYPEPKELRGRKESAVLPKCYFLHVGTLEPRKNVTVLLDAYAALPARIRSDCRLILAGPLGWGGQSYWATLSNHPMSSEVLATGYVSDQDLGLLLAGARAVLSPSRYEGFGMPLLEAMVCGRPVICSSAEAFKEVAGDTVEMIDPDNISGWSGAMQNAIEKDDWREGKAKAGRRLANEFSWDVTARRHAEVLSAVMRT